MTSRCLSGLALRTGARFYSNLLLRFQALSTSSSSADGFLAAVCSELGKPLQMVKQQRKPLGQNDVRIKIDASAVNFSDTMMVQGKYQVEMSLPYIPGYELSGRVLEVGSEVGRLKPGDHVLGVILEQGGFAEEIVTSEQSLFPISAGLAELKSPSEGAALLVSYGTAYLALQRRAKIQPGDVVFVSAAAGSLGLAAVDLAANVFGAQVIGACGGLGKRDLIKKYGAVETIDYNTENVKNRLKELTGGRGVDVAFDVVGGQVLEDCVRCMAFEGRLLTLGWSSGEIPKIAANLLLVKNFSMHGVFWGGYGMNNQPVFRDSKQSVVELWKAGKIRPHVGKVFPLAQVNEAMEHLKSRTSTGKVILDCCTESTTATHS